MATSYFVVSGTLTWNQLKSRCRFGHGRRLCKSIGTRQKRGEDEGRIEKFARWDGNFMLIR